MCEESVSEDRSLQGLCPLTYPPVCVWGLVWSTYPPGCGLGGLWTEGFPPPTYPDASLSPQTFIFTDSPDENLQERLGNTSAGVVVLHRGHRVAVMEPWGPRELCLLPLALVTTLFPGTAGVRGCWRRPIPSVASVLLGGDEPSRLSEFLLSLRFPRSPS